MIHGVESFSTFHIVRAFIRCGMLKSPGRKRDEKEEVNEGGG